MGEGCLIGGSDAKIATIVSHEQDEIEASHEQDEVEANRPKSARQMMKAVNALVNVV